MDTTWHLFLVIVIPVLLSYVYAILTGQQTTQLIPVFYAFAVIWVYCFSIFDRLKLGLNLIIPFLVLFAIALLFITKKSLFNLNELKSQLSPALIFFFLASYWTFKHSINMKFYEWDEFSYWGAAAKTIFSFEQIPALSPNPGAFPEYLPGIPLLGSLFIVPGGIWKEALLYWAYQVFIIALMTSILSLFNWKSILKFLLGFVFAILSVTFFYNPFQSVYADPVMSILFGYCLFVAGSRQIVQNKTYLLSLSILLAFLSLTKDIATVFVFICLFVLFLNLFFRKSQTKFWKTKFIIATKQITVVFVVLFPSLTIKILWRYLINREELIQGREFFTFLRSFISGNVLNESNTYLNNIKENFIFRVTDSPLTGFNGIQISTFNLLLVFALLLLLTYPNLPNWSERLNHLSTAIFLSFTGVLYLWILFVVYTTFSPGEALNLASFERYVGAWFAGIVVYLCAKSVEFLSQHEFDSPNSNKMAVFLIFLFLQSSPAKVFGFVTNPNTYADQIRGNYRAQSWLISEMALDENNKVWVITQHKVGFEFYLIQYELIPAQVGKIPFSIGSAFGPEDLWTDTSYDVKKWSKALQEYDYVFVDTVSESFTIEFKSMFEDPATLNQLPGFYKINKSGERVSLVRAR